jgi:hypothetical protein
MGIVVLLVGGLLAFPTLAHAAGVQADFDGDGYDDLAVGVPFEDLGGKSDVGVVHVIYGSPTGLTATGDQLWHQDSSGIADGGEEGDRFGTSLTAGDFDGDGFDDLAVGVPREDLGGKANAGAAHVIYGSAAGLTAAGSQRWHKDKPGIGGDADKGDVFGSALTAGDFGGNGFDDLAVGVPGDTDDWGSVKVIYGSAGGLTTNDQNWHEEISGIEGTAASGDRFGASLAAGDFDSSSGDDLAVGTPGQQGGGGHDAGVVHVIYSMGPGLRAAGSQLLDQDSPGIAGAAEAGDRFGASLTAGDFDGDDDDLAVGVPGEDLGGKLDAGVVHAIYGSAFGPGLSTDSQLWHQDSPGIAGGVENGDVFGWSLTAGDFGGDGDDDLAVGVPSEDLGGDTAAGVVHAIYGSGAGLTAGDSQLWHQSVAFILDSPQDGDGFGVSLTAGDFDGDDADDLGVGVFGEGLGRGKGTAGAAHAIYGAASGLTATGSQLWHQDTVGIAGGAEAADHFGQALPG